MKLHGLILSLLCCALTPARWQIVFPTQYGGGQPLTNIFTGIPDMGTLLIDYQFYQSPDAMDVYFNETPIFSSGPVSGQGQFSIPYGLGPSVPLPTLTIVMNAVSAESVSLWEYTPTVVPVPEPGVWWLAGLGALALVRWRRRW